MKKILMILISVLVMYSCNNESGNYVEHSYHVYGNCEKCKVRIEKAAKVEGVEKAVWDVNSKLLTVKFDTVHTSSDIILLSVANAGHDSEEFPANDYAYQSLPECCHYERVEH